ncbi:hypothetical protein BC828DRAFT_398454 [Blastocladiella britannica]|nr:hypothetical protein BC828DRAFT_398454 [Blastocladiella britannica]
MLKRPSHQAACQIIQGAARAGHAQVLDWLCTFCPIKQIMFSPTHMYWFAPSIIRTIACAAVQHAHIHLLEWCKVQDKAELRASLSILIADATRHGQPPSLEWLRAYIVESGASDEYYSSGSLYEPVSSSRQIAALDWWKANYAARFMVLFPPNKQLPLELIKYGDDGLLLVDWWRAYCVETGRAFSWPVLTNDLLSKNIAYGSPGMCRWWWNDTMQRFGSARASDLLTETLLDVMCDRGSVEFFDFYWDLCADPANKFAFPLDWRPRHPFSRLSVIQWFEAKVASGTVDAAVFDIAPPKAPGALCLDALFEITSTVELAALDWWWARRNQYNLGSRLSLSAISTLVANQFLDRLQWYLDHCTLPSPLPTLTLQSIANLVSLGRADLADRQWYSTLTCAERQLTVYSLKDIVPVPVVLDYLWEHCAGVPSNIFTECASVNQALKDNFFEAANWWYAMHRVHGTAFPSAEDLSRMKGPLGREMSEWVKSIVFLRQ